MATIEDGWRSLDDLRPNPANFNEHTKDGVIEKMAARIRCNAFTAPFIVTPDNLILGGHLRRLGLMKLRSDSYPEPEGIREGWQVPVRVFTGNAVQEKAILVGDNPALDDLSYDNEALSSLLAELQADGGLEGAGYSDADLDRLIGELAEQNGGGAGESGLLDGCDPDDVPEDAPTRCKAGDLWALGEHRLLCGDSTKAEDVARLMGGEKASMVFTDPPYNVDYSADSYSDGREEKWGRIANDNLGDAFPAFCEEFAERISEVVEDGAVYACAPMRPAGIQIRQALEKRFKIKDTIIWVKDHFVVGRNDYHPQYEDIIYCVKGDRGWNGARDQSNVWPCPRVLSDRCHPTQKPVALIEKALENSSQPGAIVYEPFGGSGSTLIACEAHGRKARVIEMSEQFADVILARFEKATGRPVELLERL